MSGDFKRRWGVGAAVILALTASPVLAAPSYVFDNTTSTDIPALTGFSTTGAMMDNMTVVVKFAAGADEARLWADTGANSGGVSGTGWALSVDGDTFAALWNFTSDRIVQRLTLTGNTGRTVFDVDMYNNPGPCDSYTPVGGAQTCSDGSALGARMTFTDDELTPQVTYSDIVGLGGSAPVGDLFHVVTVDFGVNGIRGNFSFRQDTDNDSRFGVPIPGTVALLGLGLGLLGLTRRRRS